MAKKLSVNFPQKDIFVASVQQMAFRKYSSRKNPIFPGSGVRKGNWLDLDFQIKTGHSMDSLFNAADNALRTLFAPRPAGRPCPTVAGQDTKLDAPDKALSGALMRVNHVGEICAQALYAS